MHRPKLKPENSCVPLTTWTWFYIFRYFLFYNCRHFFFSARKWKSWGIILKGQIIGPLFQQALCLFNFSLRNWRKIRKEPTETNVYSVRTGHPLLQPELCCPRPQLNKQIKQTTKHSTLWNRIKIPALDNKNVPWNSYMKNYDTYLLNTCNSGNTLPQWVLVNKIFCKTLPLFWLILTQQCNCSFLEHWGIRH